MNKEIAQHCLCKVRVYVFVYVCVGAECVSFSATFCVARITNQHTQTQRAHARAREYQSNSQRCAMALGKLLLLSAYVGRAIRLYAV